MQIQKALEMSEISSIHLTAGEFARIWESADEFWGSKTQIKRLDLKLRIERDLP